MEFHAPLKYQDGRQKSTKARGFPCCYGPPAYDLLQHHHYGLPAAAAYHLPQYHCHGTPSTLLYQSPKEVKGAAVLLHRNLKSLNTQPDSCRAALLLVSLYYAYKYLFCFLFAQAFMLYFGTRRICSLTVPTKAPTELWANLRIVLKCALSLCVSRCRRGW